MRIAIITGATSGMGKEMVKIISKEASHLDEIWLMGRSLGHKNKLTRKNGQDYRLFGLDLTSREDCREFYGFLDEMQPEIDIFVHAAGFGIMGKLCHIPTDQLEDMVDLNVRSYVGLTGHILPYMTQGGQMIYYSSASAFLPQPGFAVYAASKAFVLSYVRSLRYESASRNIRVTAVCPGAVKTPFFDRAAEGKTIPFYKKMVMADPQKVAKRAWKDSVKGKEISIYGLPMKAFCLMTKILPHSLFLHFMKS